MAIKSLFVFGEYYPNDTIMRLFEATNGNRLWLKDDYTFLELKGEFDPIVIEYMDDEGCKKVLTLRNSEHNILMTKKGEMPESYFKSALDLYEVCKNGLIVNSRI